MVLDAGAAIFLALAGVGYLVGIRRLAAHGRQWPVLRTVVFVAAWTSLVVATQGWIPGREDESLTIHAVQHTLLGMVAPLLLALSAPVTLALQATARRTQEGLLTLVHSRAVALVTHPLVASAVFAGSVVALYLTPLLDLTARNGVVHAGVHVHVLVAGAVFLWPLVSPDPVRRRLPHGARLLVVVLTVPVHAVVGLALLGSEAVAADAYPDIAAQHIAGGVLWATGDLLGVAAAALVLAQWIRHDAREAVREDRRLDAATAVSS